MPQICGVAKKSKTLNFGKNSASFSQSPQIDML